MSLLSHTLHSLTQMEFVWPWVFVLLPLPWFINRFVKPVQRRHSPLLAPHIVKRIHSSLPKENLVEVNQTRRPIPYLAIAIWMTLLTAIARPTTYIDATPFEVSGKEMVLAVDLSDSMRKQDMYLNGQDVDRLTAVKSVITEFIEQRKGDRIGLVVFGTQAFLQSPLTYDLTTLNTLLNESEIGMAGSNTAIGDAIGLTLKHFQQKKLGSHAHIAVLILLTDGSNTAGVVEPIEAAHKAQQMGLKIYTVGVGKVKSRVGLDRFLTNKSDMDIDTLTKIAEHTGGQFFQANDTEQLSQIYKEINKLESVNHEVYSYRLRSEYFHWPLSITFLLSLVLAWRQYQQAGS